MLSVAFAREPVAADTVIINAILAVVAIVLHFTALGLAGALRVPWRRGPLLIWLSITMLPLVIAYVALVGLILVPPAALPDPRDRAFFAATLVLFLLTAIALWPVTEIAATSRPPACGTTSHPENRTLCCGVSTVPDPWPPRPSTASTLR